MKLLRTVKLRLNEPASTFEPTIQAYTQAFNLVCQTGFPTMETNGVELHKQTYQQTRPSLPSQLAISARVKATEALRSVKTKTKDAQKENAKRTKWNQNNPGKRPRRILNIPRCPHSVSCSIRLDKNSYSLWREDRVVSILTVQGRQRFTLSVPRYFERYWDWKHTSADLFVRDGRAFLHVVFEKDIADVTPNGRLIGVDRGIKKLATTSDNRFFGGGRIKHISNRYQEQRRQLRSKIAQGSRSAQRHFSTVRRKEARFRAAENHCISKQIVSRLQSGDTLVLEKLTGIRGGSFKLRKEEQKEVNRWNFYQLEFFLTYKAEAAGVRVEYVDARYTSQRCSRCGNIERANRESQSVFRCRHCGFSLNADLNAARNVCLKYLDATGYPSTAVFNQPNSGFAANAPSS